MTEIIQLDRFIKPGPPADPYYDDEPDICLPTCVACSSEDSVIYMVPLMESIDCAPDCIVGVICVECGARVDFDEEYFSFNTETWKEKGRRWLGRFLTFCGVKDYC